MSELTESQNLTLDTEFTLEDKIFAAIYNEDDRDKKLEYSSYVALKLNSDDIFENEYALLYSIHTKFPKIKPDVEFLKMFIATNRAVINKRNNISLEEYVNGEGTDPLIEFTNSVVSIYNNILKMRVEENDFYMSVEKIRMEYLTRKSVQVLEEGALIVSEGATIRRKQRQGFEDMNEHVVTGLSNLKKVEDGSKRKGLITIGEDEDNEEEAKLKPVINFGIKGLDNALTALYEGDMVSLIAPPKGFKSRISAFIVHHAIVNGVSSSVWSLENGYHGFQAIIRARHFDWYYNSNETDIENIKIINSEMIRTSNMTPEIKELERISYLDLKKNLEYGKLTIIDEDCTPASLIPTLKKSIDKYGAKLILVDYLQLLSGNGEKSKSQVIGDAYKECLQFCKREKVAGLFPGQIKQEVVNEIAKKDDVDLSNLDLRTAGGETAEVIRTPDINIGIWATLEQIKRGDIKLISIPSRNSSPFEPIQLLANGGVSSFIDVTEMSV